MFRMSGSFFSHKLRDPLKENPAHIKIVPAITLTSTDLAT